MEISFNSIKPHNSRVNRKLMRSAIRFYANELMHSNLVKNLSVHVKYVRDLTKNDKVYAYCDYDQSGEKPRDFTFELDPSIGKRLTLVTLAHEMYHVKQYATGELKDYLKMSNKVRWQGQKIDYDVEEYNRDGDDYPFEQEAIKGEEALYYKFKNSEYYM